MFVVKLSDVFLIFLISVINLRFADSQDCGAPAAPTNGIVDAPVTTTGSVATYSCDAGYTLSGDTTRTCDGTNWDGTLPTCDPNDCGTPAAPANGAVDFSSGTVYLNTATFTCNTGYDLSGQSSRTCQADGTWETPFPTCVIKDCGTPTAPTNGAVDFSSGTVYLNTATFTCNTGYDLSGQSSRTCQADGTWQTPFPTCAIKDCGTPTAPTNGAVDFSSGTVYLNTATFTCNTGYDLSGQSSRTCQADGTWETPFPACVIKDCGIPTAPTNGAVDFSSGTVYLNTATFTCNTGYDLSGQSSRTCQADGTWETPFPTCVIKDCGTPTAPTNGAVDFSSGTVYLNTATFTCNTGYDLSGQSSRTCQADGTWQTPFPTCVIKDCGTPIAPTNGAVDFSSGTVYLNTATFTCNTGYDLSGQSSRTCQADGTWETPFPTCAIKDCGIPTAPTNGAVDFSSGTVYLKTATFTCNTGYDLSGQSSRTCQADGTWETPFPTCVIKDCGTPTAPTNGAVDFSSGTVYLNTATFTCNTGYDLSGQSSRTCQADGTWQTPFPTCVIKDCGSLTAAANTQIDTPGGTTYGSEAVYSCDPGYEISSVADKRTCESTGMWSADVPACTIVDCGPLSNPTNGQVSVPSTTYLSVATFNCVAGYDLIGGTTRTCQADSIWNSTTPTCQPKDCGAPAAPTNGIVDAPVTTTGAVATYSCDAGYTLSGDTTRTCDGTNWDGTLPTCAINDCGSLTNPANGQVSVNTTTYLSVAAYKCDTGYDLIGGTTRTCQADTTWSSTAPTCQVKDCGALTNPTNGQVTTNDGTEYGDTATYTCTVGYNLVGSSSRSCGADGNWDGAAPSCTPKDCGTPPAISNGVYSAPTTTYASTATYSCNAGYGIVGSASILCQSDGIWDSNTPTCQEDCGTPPTITGGTVSNPGGTIVGATATYTCDSGYTLSGGATITCQAGGSWSSGPSCLANLNAYNSACTSASDCQTSGASCLDDGSGTTVCTCSSTTVYDASQDACLNDCGGLSNPTNGMVSVPSQTVEGQIATYTCNAGYAISGSSTRTCTASGWSGTAPTCSDGCPEPDPPLNGQVNITDGFTSGSVVVYYCDTGYALVGSATRICLTDTTWNGQSPTCNKECPVLTDIEHGTVDLSLGNWADSVATYICDKDYALVGQATRTCQSTGLWTGVTPNCLFGMFPDILIVFGVFIVLLLLVDVLIVGLYLYYKVYKAKKPEEEDEEDDEVEDKMDEKKPALLPFMLERPDDAGIAPASFVHAQNRKSKYSKIAPEMAEDPEVRFRNKSHPPPRKPQMGSLKTETNERPSFLKTPRDKKATLGREKTFEATTLGPVKDRFKSDMMQKGPENSFFIPQKPEKTADEFPGKDGYNSGHSDESNQRGAPSPAEADQMTLDDFEITEPKANSTLDRTKLSLQSQSGPSFPLD